MKERYGSRAIIYGVLSTSLTVHLNVLRPCTYVNALCICDETDHLSGNLKTVWVLIWIHKCLKLCSVGYVQNHTRGIYPEYYPTKNFC